MKQYYQDAALTIRDLCAEDIPLLVAAECAQGWHATPEKLENRLRDVERRGAVVIAAVTDGVPVGYVSVYPDAVSGPFVGTGWPEIVDFNVLVKYRRRGIGSRLMDCAEQIAAQYADTVTLGVGMHSGYGAAQRLYVLRGYVPDGSGVWVGDRIGEPYAMCENGDSLVLHLSKKLQH